MVMGVWGEWHYMCCAIEIVNTIKNSRGAINF